MRILVVIKMNAGRPTPEQEKAILSLDKSKDVLIALNGLNITDEPFVRGGAPGTVEVMLG